MLGEERRGSWDSTARAKGHDTLNDPIGASYAVLRLDEIVVDLLAIVAVVLLEFGDACSRRRRFAGHAVHDVGLAAQARIFVGGVRALRREDAAKGIEAQGC